MKESEAIRHLERHHEFLRNAWKPHPDHECLDSICMAIAALRKQVPQKPKHELIKYGRHRWKKNKYGNIDEMAWESGFHSGVICENCGETVCTLCEPDYDSQDNNGPDDCYEENWRCPECGKHVYKDTYCSYCGQRIDWR